MQLNLSGKNVIITGGTRGIGRATAQAFASEGANIALCARNAHQVEEAVTQLSQKGVNAYGDAINIGDHKRLRSWINQAAEQLGSVDIVIANPSAFGAGASEDDWKVGYEIDLMGSVTTINAALPYLEETAAKGGMASALMLASVSAAETDMESAYGAYKAGLIHYGKGLARRLAPQNIRVNTISPGTIYVDDGFWGNAKRHMPDLYEHFFSGNPMGRMGDPKEVADAALFFSSSAASFITGSNLVIDGGWSSRVNY